MSFKTDLRDAVSQAAKDVLDAVGDSASWTNQNNTAITVSCDAGPMSQETREELGIDQEATARTFLIPSQAGLLAYITTKALTTNVVTLTTSPAHGFVAGGQVLIVLDTADSTFDGYQIVVSAASATTFTYAKTASNVTSVAATGYARGIINIGDKITFESVPYDVVRVTVPDGIWAAYVVETVRRQAQALGTL